MELIIKAALESETPQDFINKVCKIPVSKTSAIWFCIAYGGESNSLFEAAREFMSDCKTGKITHKQLVKTQGTGS